MSTKRRYLKVIKKLDDRKFVTIKRWWSGSKKLQTLADNLWSMFHLDDIRKTMDMEAKKELFIKALDDNYEGMSVNDFAWTPEVRKAFYNHPSNKVAKKLVGPMFMLNIEPSELRKD